MSTITVDVQINDTIHYTMLQNHIPIIEKLVILNKSDKHYSSLQVRISFSPEFIVTKEMDIKSLEAGSLITLMPITLVPSMEYLLSQQQIEQGKIKIVISEKDSVLYTYTKNITILAYDMWLGLGLYPELLAAYCTPNRIAVLDIIEHTQDTLDSGNSNVFTGYCMDDKDAVFKQMITLYNAIKEYKFELTKTEKVKRKNYQKIRFVDLVVANRYATSLEIALLFASCLEYVALNPIIVLAKGKTLVGCLLRQETYQDKVVQVSADVLEQDIIKERLCLIDCCDTVMNEKADFWQSQLNVQAKLHNESTVTIIDIKSCRNSGIYPLPIPSQKDRDEDFGLDHHMDIETDWNSIITKRAMLTHQMIENKQKLWEEKLIDLSNKNSLINFATSYDNAQIVTVNLFELQEQLNREEQFTLVPMNSFLSYDWNCKVITPKDFEYVEEYVSMEFNNRNIPMYLKEEEISERLNHIVRQARQSINETGANSLYLALGFLKWYEKQEDDKERYAPLILLPVELIKERNNKQFKLFLRDEEAVMNHTLLAVLGSEFNLTFDEINPLPFDECGVDLSQVFKVVRKKIQNFKRWEVEEAAFIGVFSHNQYVNWKDFLNHIDRIHTNKVTESLLSGKAVAYTQATIDTNQIIPSILTDSNQLEAIGMLHRGISFTLSAPTGCRKPQLIANLLAECMKQGKRTLVISKKDATIRAIKQELSNLELDPYCLYAFSEYATKKEILKQFNNTLNDYKEKSNIDYEENKQQLHMIKDDINKVIKAIHQKREYGMSLYDAIIQYEEYKEYRDQLKIDDVVIAKMKEGDYEKWLATVNQCRLACNECRDDVSQLFKNYHNTEYSMEIRSSFVSDCKELLDEFNLLQEYYSNIKVGLGLPVDEKYQDFKIITEILELASNSCYLLDEIMLEPNNESKEKKLYEVVQYGREKVRLEEEILQEFREDIFSYDVFAAKDILEKSTQCWFIKKYFLIMKLVYEVKRYAYNPKNIDRLSLTIWIDKLTRYQELLQYMDALPTSITSQFSYLWQGVNTNWDKLKKALTDTLQIRDACRLLPLERTVYVTMVQKLSQIVILQGRERDNLNKQITAYQNSFRKCMLFLTQLAHQYNASLEEFQNHDMWIEDTKQELKNWIAHSNELRDWSAYLKQLDELRQLGFAETANVLETRLYNPDDVVSSFICNVNLAIIKRIMQAEPILISGQGACHEQQLRKYIALTKAFIKESNTKLSYQAYTNVKQCLAKKEFNEDIAFLKKAIKTEGELTNLTSLFAQANELIRSLYSCMIMSPVYIASYLNEEYHSFDYVIVEEASTIDACEAVSALTRGENCIIIGDNNLSTIESLYEDCSLLHMPNVFVRWLYHTSESITAFRNREFYQEQLVSFPSAIIKDEVQVHMVNGALEEYSYVNQEETLAVLDLIKNIRGTDSKESIGVITFNKAQQYRIMEMLDEEFSKNKEWYQLESEHKEPIYVKSLNDSPVEERDIIILSTVYGKESSKMTSMDFGVLSSVLGANKLHSAVSLTRHTCHIVTSILADDINLTSTRSDGVIKLKNLLDFSSNQNIQESYDGDEAWSSIENMNNCDDRIVMNIASELKKIGYEVRCNLGESANKVDLAILDSSGTRYMLGILLYGQQKEEANIVNQNMLINIEQLQKLGWNLYVVWILDWLDNPNKVIKKICEKIIECKESEKSEYLTSEHNESMQEIAVANI